MTTAETPQPDSDPGIPLQEVMLTNEQYQMLVAHNDSLTHAVNSLYASEGGEDLYQQTITQQVHADGYYVQTGKGPGASTLKLAIVSEDLGLGLDRGLTESLANEIGADTLLSQDEKGVIYELINVRLGDQENRIPYEQTYNSINQRVTSLLESIARSKQKADKPSAFELALAAFISGAGKRLPMADQGRVVQVAQELLH